MFKKMPPHLELFDQKRNKYLINQELTYIGIMIV